MRINNWIRGWLSEFEVDFTKYSCRQGGYWHLPLEEKKKILEQITFEAVTVCEDVTEQYHYWREQVNPDPQDCCYLRK